VVDSLKNKNCLTQGGAFLCPTKPNSRNRKDTGSSVDGTIKPVADAYIYMGIGGIHNGINLKA